MRRQTCPAPLAARLRPVSLADFMGQGHLVGPGKPLRRAIEERHAFSFILWGPPGSGKTTLARIYAASLNALFFELSALSSGKEDIRKILAQPAGGATKVLFLDEIHRFNKSQQNYLLPFVESGALSLIGATTENPSFEVIAPLLSRCRVFTLRPLEPGDVVIVDPEHDEHVALTTRAYDPMVAGIIATKPGMLLDADTTGGSVVLVGRVPTKVTTENGPIHRGDVLVTASKPGYAMRGDPQKIQIGMVIGKAMGELDDGDGTIVVLVNLQ